MWWYAEQKYQNNKRRKSVRQENVVETKRLKWKKDEEDLDGKRNEFSLQF